MKLPMCQFNNKAEFELYKMDLHNQYKYFSEFETNLVEENLGKETFAINAYCQVCSSDQLMIIDYNYGDKFNLKPNFRERLVCEGCGLNNRQRACVHILEKNLNISSTSHIYISEQTTDLFACLKERFPLIEGSEFLSDGTLLGQSNKLGIRNEDSTQLSFADGSMDTILTFDCLEHIPNYKKALNEFYRVIKSGGILIITVPFVLNNSKNIIRAVIDCDGKIEHIEPPEYHGDPVNNQGVLCYYHFGWELLNEIREAGFSEAGLFLYHSCAFGYLGGHQMLLISRK